MSDLIWWTLFVIALFSLLIVTTKFILRLVLDCCCDVESSENDSAPIIQDYAMILNNLEVKKVDIDDKRPLMAITHEVEVTKLEEDKQKKSKVQAEVPEDDADLGEKCESIDSLDFLEIDLSSRSSSSASFEKISERDTFNSQEDKEIYDRIQLIRGEVEIYARRIPFFLGGARDLQYFEMNEKFILSMIDLGRIDCHDKKDLLKVKNDAMMYFKECQERLKKQAENKAKP